MREARARAAASPAPRIVIRPEAVDEAGFTVTPRNGPDGPYYQARGTKPERWVRQTDFANDEAVGYLADRLAKIGIEDELFRIGAKPGDTVVIGSEESGVIFDRQPTMMTGAELLGPRGSDDRFEDDSAPPARTSAASTRTAWTPSRAPGTSSGPSARPESGRTRRRADEWVAKAPSTGSRHWLVATGGAMLRPATSSARPGIATAPTDFSPWTASRADNETMNPVNARSEVALARRLVIKVGSSSLTTPEGALDLAYPDRLVDVAAARRLRGHQVVIVTSGAIAAGLSPSGWCAGPRTSPPRRRRHR